MLRIGGGMLTCGGPCRGTVRSVTGVADVLRLMQMDLGEVILLMHAASATFVTPLFPLIRGVICTTGGATSHLAIVAREFNLSCVMAAHIDYGGGLDGGTVSFTEAGELYLEQEP
jgi:phosphoenolpyruvate-protein kinase (PTS system EI component)